MKRLILLLLTAGLASAFTDHWVSSSGSGNGLSSGAPMSLTDFEDYMVTGGSFNAAAGDRFYIKKDGTYARTTNTDTWVNGGSATSPVVIIGYLTTETDGYQGRTSTYGDLVTTNMPVITYTTGKIAITGTFIICESLNISGAHNSASAGQVGMAANCALRSCSVTYTGTTVTASAILANASGDIVFNCDAANSGTYTVTTGGCITATNAGVKIDSCHMRVTNSAAPCLVMSNSSVAYGNLCWGSGGPGIVTNNVSAQPFVRNNTIVGCTGDGINYVTASTGLQYVVGNMITDNSGDGIDMTQTTMAAFVAYNRLRDNANSFANAGDWITATSYGQASTDTGTTGTTATDYTNYGGNIFSLINTSPATSASQPPSASAGAFQRSQTSSGAVQTSSAHGN